MKNETTDIVILITGIPKQTFEQLSLRTDKKALEIFGTLPDSNDSFEFDFSEMKDPLSQDIISNIMAYALALNLHTKTFKHNV